MKVLVTGAGGQLGQTLLNQLPATVHSVAATSAQLDLTAPNLAQLLQGFDVDLVINTAAYTAVDKAESEGRARAFAVNAIGAGALAQACAAQNRRLIHVSTDFVFGGDRGAAYLPNATTAPLNVYGASKREGEERVRAALPDALIVRTAWVYSRYGNNFVKTMLRLMAERESLGVVSDQIGTPTWTQCLAQAIWVFALHPELTGTYHYTDAGVASWYDFAVAIQEEAIALGLLQRAIPIKPITSDDYPQLALRPHFSVLDKRSTYRALNHTALHWRAALRAMLKDYRDTLNG